VTVSEVVKVMTANVTRARALIRAAVPALAKLRAAGPCPKGCDHALDGAIMTAKDARDPAMLEKTRAFTARFIAKESAS
jgi:5'-methylthioadenosine phosphorylase